MAGNSQGQVIMTEDPKRSEYDKLMWDYIATLESLNHSLLDALSKCVRVMAALKDTVPDPEGWQKMLDKFEDMIKVGKKTSLKKTLH